MKRTVRVVLIRKQFLYRDRKPLSHLGHAPARDLRRRKTVTFGNGGAFLAGVERLRPITIYLLWGDRRRAYNACSGRSTTGLKFQT